MKQIEVIWIWWKFMTLFLYGHSPMSLQIASGARSLINPSKIFFPSVLTKVRHSSFWPVNCSHSWNECNIHSVWFIRVFWFLFRVQNPNFSQSFQGSQPLTWPLFFRTKMLWKALFFMFFNEFYSFGICIQIYTDIFKLRK